MYRFVCGYPVGLEPVFDDVGLVVGDGHTVTHTQHLQQVQEPVVLKQPQEELRTRYPGYHDKTSSLGISPT